MSSYRRSVGVRLSYLQGDIYVLHWRLQKSLGLVLDLKVTPIWVNKNWLNIAVHNDELMYVVEDESYMDIKDKMYCSSQRWTDVLHSGWELHGCKRKDEIQKHNNLGQWPLEIYLHLKLNKVGLNTRLVIHFSCTSRSRHAALISRPVSWRHPGHWPSHRRVCKAMIWMRVFKMAWASCHPTAF